MAVAMEELKDFPSSIMPGVRILEREGQTLFPIHVDGVLTLTQMAYLEYPQPDHHNYMWGFNPFDPLCDEVGQVLAEATRKFKEHLLHGMIDGR